MNRPTLITKMLAVAAFCSSCLLPHVVYSTSGKLGGGGGAWNNGLCSTVECCVTQAPTPLLIQQCKDYIAALKLKATPAPIIPCTKDKRGRCTD